jgi:hypothetical protein
MTAGSLGTIEPSAAKLTGKLGRYGGRSVFEF